MKTAEIEEIKQNLTLSCMEFKAYNFLPYLLSPLVRVHFPNKIRFYNYLKDIIQTAKIESSGALELRIEANPWQKDEKLKSYNFYDQLHKAPQINLLVREYPESIFIDLKPF